MRSTPGVAFFGCELVESHVMSCRGATTTAGFDRFESRPVSSPGCPGAITIGVAPGSSPGATSPATTRERWPGASKPRNIRERKSPAAHMHAAQLGAPGERRENLAGVEQALVVKGAFQALLVVEIGL